MYVGAGRDFGWRGLELRPFGSLHYTRLTEDGFRESGAGSAGLIVEDRAAQTLLGEAGVRARRPVVADWGRLVPELSIGVDHAFDLGDGGVEAALAEAPGERFTIPGAEPGGTGLRLGARLGFTTPGGSTFELRATHRANDSFATHRASDMPVYVGVRIPF